jgi:hypothetical protein
VNCEDRRRHYRFHSVFWHVRHPHWDDPSMHLVLWGILKMNSKLLFLLCRAFLMTGFFGMLAGIITINLHMAILFCLTGIVSSFLSGILGAYLKDREEYKKIIEKTDEE